MPVGSLLAVFMTERRLSLGVSRVCAMLCVWCCECVDVSFMPQQSQLQQERARLAELQVKYEGWTSIRGDVEAQKGRLDFETQGLREDQVKLRVEQAKFAQDKAALAERAADLDGAAAKLRAQILAAEADAVSTGFDR